MTSSSEGSAVERLLHLAGERPGELIAIVGPTASGKTALAVSLAERLGGEIVSADSVQIYREFDRGSGKPTPEELARAPHHLVSAIEPLDPIDASSWADAAARAVDEVRARGRTPILCGGTFLWVKALIFGLARAPAGDPALRDRHRAIVRDEGRRALHERLRAVDPQAASRLHPNDVVRVSRALEVFELTRRPMSELHGEHGFAHPLRPTRLVALACDAPSLTDRIRRRVMKWMAEGWVDEVERLLARGYGGARAMSSVGYAQIRAMIAGEIPRDALEDAIVRATRIFARRQRTWLNHQDVVWLTP
jgi:tRNA dimethylallyltransferase